MSRKDAINSLFLTKKDTPTTASQKPAERVRTGAVSAMSTSLRQMADGAKLASQLQDQLAKGDVVIEIDPELIDHSTVADRIPTDVDPAFDQLASSISENGQQVPILVRPSPTSPERFQIAYGRRRLRAAQILKRPVRAIVRRLEDQELIIAQGRENLDREDLSFIEKAFFAKNLEDAGCDRATIVAALSSDKADVSRYVAVARRVSERIVKRIGPAPKAGRARWLALAEKLEMLSDSSEIDKLLDGQPMQSATSDARFQAVLSSLEPENAKRKHARTSVWKAPSGKRAANIEAKNGKTSLVFEDKIVPEFAQFVTEKLDDLFQEFQSTKGRSDR